MASVRLSSERLPPNIARHPRLLAGERPQRQACAPPAFIRTTWRVYTWSPDEQTRRLVLGIAAGLLAHQIFGLTDAFMLGTKPGIVMWILVGIITGMYLKLAPVQRGMRNDEC